MSLVSYNQDELPPVWLMYLLKVFRRSEYRRLRDLRHRQRVLRKLRCYCEGAYPFAPPQDGRSCSFKHSGNAGDVIYSLPCIRAVAGTRPAELRLKLDVPLRHQHKSHPLGGVMLNRGMFDRLYPLLSSQPYLGEVSVHDGSPVDYDLDVFRDSPMSLERLNISRWYFYFHGVTADLSRPWLAVEPDSRFAGTVVLSRSFRYRNTGLDYRFLAGAGPLVFVGLENEYLDMRSAIPGLEWFRVDDFLQLARAIAGCRLFIGNQSFPFSLAEALKVPRILETDPLGPNVVPAGVDGYDVLFQKQFEYLVERLRRRGA